MKNTLLIFSFILLISNVVAQSVSKTINISTTGTLTTSLSTIEKNTVTNLTITGVIDARDIKCMRDEMPLLSVLDIKGVTIAAYSGTDGTATSSILTDYPIEEVPVNSFSNYTKGKTSLTKIYLSSTIASIGDSAFYNCTSLVKFSIAVASQTLPNFYNDTFTGVATDTGIDANNCILEVPYGYNEYYLGWGGFVTVIEKGIKYLTGLTAGSLSSLLSADDKATIIKLTIDGEIDARDVKCMRDEMPLLSLLDISTVSIKEYNGAGGTSITSINAYPANEMPAFSFFDGTSGKNSLTNFILPSNITSIGQSAFYKCTGLSNDLAIPNSVTSIGIYAFSGCENLINNRLTLPDNLTIIEDGAFEKCSKITGDLIIKNKVVSISNSAFRNCTGLTGTLEIPNSVASIGYYAFENCLGFTKISVLRAVPPAIQATTFNNVDKTSCMLEVPIGTSAAYQAADYWKDFTIIEKGLKVINLTTAGTLSTLLTADEKLSITNLTITGELDARDIKCIRDEMSIIAVLDISNANFVTYTGTEGTLASATTYPANEMPPSSFYIGSTNGRSTLTSIKLPTSLTSIGANAFEFCNNISSIPIPGSVSTIGDYAFSNCRNLFGTLTIPNSVTTIGDFAFSNCTNISKVLDESAIPPVIQANTFQFFNKNTCILEVPNGATATYQAADYWKEFNSVIDGISNPIETKYVISIVDKNVTINNVENTPVFLYDCLGRCITINTDSNATKELMLSKSGIYILRINNYRTKIIVK